MALFYININSVCLGIQVTNRPPLLVEGNRTTMHPPRRPGRTPEEGRTPKLVGTLNHLFTIFLYLLAL